MPAIINPALAERLKSLAEKAQIPIESLIERVLQDYVEAAEKDPELV
jgi:predicted transcriptional regulator